MVSILTQQQINELSFLKSIPVEFGKEFVNITMKFILGNPKPRVLLKAAEKLQVDIEVIQKCIESITYLYTQSSKTLISKEEFGDFLKVIQIEEELRIYMIDQYEQQNSPIRKFLNKMTFELPYLKTMEWRLDVQLASRKLREQFQPYYIIRITTSDDKIFTMYCDFHELKEITDQLERALSEIRSQHFQRIHRYIK
ncbi:comm domain containing protein [Anaeramoeba ignava]|uniref:Comm domain containing protein n=1 Tax=Anaeramoeba ignava TaxID=1746090 RepID=A0A9Q0LQ89_ANAIG|nr:comm domain containing protein [Anaeramoeba ignava]|eukprot:Anaeramoba_ignava/a608311_25.p1 GENE.a608311_25~~a608311_25.p1  ORF type:complete len:197 (-),score=54.22 a608311_25:102-692(-)